MADIRLVHDIKRTLKKEKLEQLFISIMKTAALNDPMLSIEDHFSGKRVGLLVGKKLLGGIVRDYVDIAIKEGTILAMKTFINEIIIPLYELRNKKAFFECIELMNKTAIYVLEKESDKISIQEQCNHTNQLIRRGEFEEAKKEIQSDLESMKKRR